MIVLAASYLLILIAFTLIAWATPARGWRLFLALLALGAGVGSFNLLIEAIAFGVIAWAQAANAFAMQLGVFALLAALVTLASPKRPATSAPTLRLGPLRIAGVVLGYEALYVTAGMLVFPYVAAFYADHHIPAIGEVLALQAMRALVFVASSILVLRGGLRFAPLVLGVAFSVIGGLSPLLPDNPLMPPEVRVPHAVEVGISNFLFGALTGWLLTRGNQRRTAAA